MAEAPLELPVERGKVKEFATALRAVSPVWHEPDATVPPTFPILLHWGSPDLMLPEGAGVDMRRVLHGGQEFVFHGPPPRVGDVLHGTPVPAQVAEKEGRRGGSMRVVTTGVEWRDGSGALRVTSRTTLLELAGGMQ